MNNSRGFTLIELMVVIGVIAAIAVIAIPNFLEGRRMSNESSAIATLRAYISAQELFRERDMDGDGRYIYAGAGASGLVRLNPRPDGSLDDYKEGYLFGILDPIPPATNYDTWRAVGVPLLYGKSGVRAFAVDESGVIRFTTTQIPFSDPGDFSSWPPVGS